ncbi:MAG: hypothetical protein LRS46_00750, partial [Desulfurococcales archaeon]|nr:hypothetical protein [Desulfurococcales archaeon]
PGALKHLLNLISIIYEEVLPSQNSAVALEAYKALSDMDSVFSIIGKELREARWEEAIPTDALVDLIIEVRTELRKKRMYELSDYIRERLLNLGIRVLDYRDRSEWYIESGKRR